MKTNTLWLILAVGSMLAGCADIPRTPQEERQERIAKRYQEMHDAQAAIDKQNNTQRSPTDQWGHDSFFA